MSKKKTTNIVISVFECPECKRHVYIVDTIKNLQKNDTDIVCHKDGTRNTSDHVFKPITENVFREYAVEYVPSKEKVEVAV